MSTIPLRGGLDLDIPIEGITNWDETLLKETWINISEHDHSGGGKGKPIGGSSLEDDSISGTKICLNNNEYLRGKNTSGQCLVNILKVDTDNKVLLNEPKINCLQVDTTLSLNNTATAVTSLLPLDTSIGYKIDYRFKDEAAASSSDYRYSVGVLLLSYNGTSWDVSNTSAGDCSLNLTATGTNLQYFFDTATTGSSQLQYIVTKFNK